MTGTDKLSQVALHLIPGVGNANSKQLISYCGSSSEVFHASRRSLQKIPGIGSKTIDSILGKSTFDQAETILLEAEDKGIQVLHYTDKTYPHRMKQVYDAPNIIYVKGDITFNASRLISIVGTRKASEYGKSVTSGIVEGLAQHGTTIISGLAYGIDIQAHKTAINHNTPTIAILAGGLDKIYPKIHERYVNQMLETGGVVSEYPPGTTPEAHQFPARNRIIAALSDAVIVVEAAKKGGALITASIADSYSRPVFAVPGNLNRVYSEGCNNLIKRQQALIYTNIEDLAYYLNWDLETNGHEKVFDLNELMGPERRIAEVLLSNDHILTVDDLAWKSQIQINELASYLLSMEFQGLVKSLPGKKYELIA